MSSILLGGNQGFAIRDDNSMDKNSRKPFIILHMYQVYGYNCFLRMTGIEPAWLPNGT